MKILLTGAAGFIGSNLAKNLLTHNPFQLSALSFELRAFIRYNSRADMGLLAQLPKELLAQMEVIFGDLRDHSAVMQAAQGCDLIYHLGALISIPYSYQHPVETVHTNVLGTLNILEAARQLGIPVVHTSSSKVYGLAQRVPIDEGHPLQGLSPYAASKVSADKLAEAYYHSFDVPVVTIRPFNTYGPGQSPRALIPTIITQALTQDRINLGAFDSIRDYTYVDDIVAGFMMAGQALLDGVKTVQERKAAVESATEKMRKIMQAQKEMESVAHVKKPFPTDSLNPETGDALVLNPCETAPIEHPAPFIVDYNPAEEGELPLHSGSFTDELSALGFQLLGQEFNLGTGKEVTINEIIETVLKIVGKPDLPVCEDVLTASSENPDVMHLLADYAKAKEALGWQPTVELEEGLERTIAWVSDHLDYYQTGEFNR